MKDPLSTLQHALQVLFHMEATRNNKYIYPQVQALHEAIEQYNPKVKKTFFTLLKAITEAQPYIQKWRIDFAEIKKCMNHLAKKYALPSIDWNNVLSHQQTSLRFQFNGNTQTKNIQDLSAWLSMNIGSSFDQLNHFAQTKALVEHRDFHGFSNKLSEQLKKILNFYLS